MRFKLDFQEDVPLVGKYVFESVFTKIKRKTVERFVIPTLSRYIYIYVITQLQDMEYI